MFVFKTIIKMTSYKTQVIYVLLLTFFSEIASGKNWQLVWSDEFTSEIVPDWVFETGLGSSGWENNELQY